MADVHHIDPHTGAPLPSVIDLRFDFMEIRALLRLIRAALADRDAEHGEMPEIEPVQLALLMIERDKVQRINASIKCGSPLDNELAMTWYKFRAVLGLTGDAAWRVLNEGLDYVSTEDECADMEGGCAVAIDLAEQILQGLDAEKVGCNHVEEEVDHA
uniref:Uncharacterized protein n=1 Tax=mine drainage metagenome TaxID=410659 RepID=E6PQA0_9ZZZZ